MQTHELKIEPAAFRLIIEGKKKAIQHIADREFKEGDLLNLHEFEPCQNCGGTGRMWDNGDKCDCTECTADHGKFTGCSFEVRVTAIERNKDSILPPYLQLLISIQPAHVAEMIATHNKIPAPGEGPKVRFEDVPDGNALYGMAPIGRPWHARKEKGKVRPDAPCPVSEFALTHAWVNGRWYEVAQ